MKKTIASLLLATSASADLVDGSFESNDVYYGYGFIQGGIDTQWKTTAPDNLIEIWGEYMPTAAYEGTRHAELNANYASTLYQDVNGLGDNNSINWHFAHRGRYGTDVMKLTITDLGADQQWGGGDDTTIFTQNFAADDTAWQVHYGTITSIGNNTRFAFEAVSAVGGNTQGNFIDWCGFGPGVVIPTPGAVGLIVLSGLIVTRRRA
ncbi:MAG: PEP-CTERM sorting domain-containing protein [Alphaproteobacteria bacterium]|nr:PEP-CTERM sorting domain-containing protein [Alphaproteobacteria bacterium]